MKFYSTNSRHQHVSLEEAVTRGLAPDNGLYMPEHIPALPEAFFHELPNLTFREIGYAVSHALLGEDVDADTLRQMVDHTITFDAPLVPVDDDIYALELFHGPTMAFKDFGARFMSQLLGHFARRQDREIIILAATSGDTGSAVANGFLGVAGTRVVVLYPSGKVSDIQEKQFTTLGQNVVALEVTGTFDDCQRLVKQAFLDDTLRQRYYLTSANSINIARLIPQSFYYFHAYAQRRDRHKPVVFAVPSGNFGNLTGGVLAQRMGLPIHHFVAATNANDVVPEYLRTHRFTPRPSVATISNAMDVGNPSNFVRLQDLYTNDAELNRHVSGYAYTDAQTQAAMQERYQHAGYTLDPHGAIGYLGLKEYMASYGQPVQGIFLETAHPAKFKEVVEDTLQTSVEVPATLQAFLQREKHTVPMTAAFEDFKDYLLKNL